jgi:hypothetical protein
MAALADGVLAGSIIGEPFGFGTDNYWATRNTAQLVYTLPNLYRGGENGFPYHAVRLPGNFKNESAGAPLSAPMETISKFGAEVYLIRDQAGESLYLLRGSKSALLVGTGAGENGLANFIHSLISDLPLDVAILDKEPGQTGGIAQLSPRHVYVAASDILNGVPASVIADGATIDLGLDQAGKPLLLEAASFQSDGAANLSLLNAADRVLFAGNAFEKYKALALRIRDESAPTPKQDSETRMAWMEKLKGRFDTVYLASSTSWFTSPETLEATLAALAHNRSSAGEAP